MQQGNAYLALLGLDYQNNTIWDIQIHECLVGAIALEYFKSGSLVSAIQNSSVSCVRSNFLSAFCPTTCKKLLSNHLEKTFVKPAVKKTEFIFFVQPAVKKNSLLFAQIFRAALFSWFHSFQLELL